ncbi:MAG TPA: TVP38/TMEM64 family protein [Nitrospira sp.]|nr:TVP38/TMEM64 family protein [Nitrospira sp.]
METRCADGYQDDTTHPIPPLHQSTLPVPSTKNNPSGKIIIGLVIGLAIGAFFYFDLGRFLSLDVLKNNRDHLLAFTEANYVTAVGIFILAYAIVTGLSLPGAVILTLAGGFTFGAFLGTLFVNLGATTGATVAFLTARYVLRDTVERKFGKSLSPFQEGFAKNAFSYLLTLRLIPLFPFFVVNLVSGLTRVSAGTYIGATALGIIPGSFVYAYAGRQLGTINSLKEIASPNVIGAFILLGLLALVPVVYKRFAAKPVS